jgi:DNA polymerase-3 subunit beta
MQFVCNQDTFSKYLSIVSRIVSSKPGLPILSNVLFETANGKLIMSATDLEIGIHCWIGAEVKSEGKTAVPAKQLAEFVNSVPSEKIEAMLDNTMFSINTTNNFAQFNTLSSEDFPAIASVNTQQPVLRLAKQDIVEAVSKVAFAAAKDDIKPVLTAIKIELVDNVIAFVAADGLRLSRYIVKLNTNVPEKLDLLIPAKALIELANIVTSFGSEDGDDAVSFYVIEDKNQVLFRFNEIDLVSRLIDGKFPDYKAIIPTSHQTKIVLNRSEFQNSLKVANIIARNVVGNKLFVNINAKDEQVTLSATQAEVGNNKSSFAIKAEGNSLDMAFSGKYLGDVLSNIDEEELIFECSTSVAPGVFKIKDNDNFVHLLMPMRL